MHSSNTCDMYVCRLRHINDSVLSSLKMEGIRLLFFFFSLLCIIMRAYTDSTFCGNCRTLHLQIQHSECTVSRSALIVSFVRMLNTVSVLCHVVRSS
jgi:hypothetical protein